jgi:hypothetical protein
MHNPDLTLIVFAWLACSALMLPLLAFTARFGLVPLVKSVAEARSAGRAPRANPALEQRLAAVELQLAALASSVDRIANARAALPGRSSHPAGATGGHPAH